MSDFTHAAVAIYYLDGLLMVWMVVWLAWQEHNSAFGAEYDSPCWYGVFLGIAPASKSFLLGPLAPLG